MADSSFDIVSEINLQEMDNAINQAQKEIGTRYDFKGSSAKRDRHSHRAQFSLGKVDFPSRRSVDRSLA